MKLIIVDGPSGSGKSTLCNELNKNKYIKCYDNDDIYQISFQSVYKKYKKENKKFWKMVDNMVITKINKIYESANNNAILVFVGSQKMPQLIYDNADHFFIIKITNYKEAYRRRIIRDYIKISDNINKIKSFSRSDPIENLSTFVNHNLMINTQLPYYQQWKIDTDNYYDTVKNEWKMEHSNIMTFEKILNKIMKMV